MPQKQNHSVKQSQLENAMREIVTEIIAELEKIIASKKDISEFTELVLSRLESIDRHFIELKEEMRTLKVMYEFWADRHLSPDLIEEFLDEQEKKRKSIVKRVD